MKLHIKKNGNPYGMIELFLILPLFLGLLCIIAWIGFLLISQSKMDKHAWVIQTRQTYNLPNHALVMNKNYKIESDHTLKNIINTATTFTQNLPLSFRTFVVLHKTLFRKLLLEDRSPSIVNNLFFSAFGENEDVRQYKLTSKMIIPGDPMNHGSITKMLMWQEAMNKAGFGYPLYMLGITELLNIPDLPLGKLGEIARILNDPKLEHE